MNQEATQMDPPPPPGTIDELVEQAQQEAEWLLFDARAIERYLRRAYGMGEENMLQQVRRLRQTLVPVIPIVDPGPLTLREALEMLISHGLAAVSDGDGIKGGRHVGIASGIEYFTEPFAIEPDGLDWICRFVDGVKIREERVGSLINAVDVVAASFLLP